MTFRFIGVRDRASSGIGPRLTGCGGGVLILLGAQSALFYWDINKRWFGTTDFQWQISIHHEGKHRKFVPQVKQITFAAKDAVREGCQVICTTERCVLNLSFDVWEMLEVAPCVDKKTDVFGQMGFELQVSGQQNYGI